MAVITYSGISAAKVKISELREVIQIQSLGRIRDGMGGYTETYEDLLQVWAKITPQRGKEIITAGQIQGQTPWKILMRYRPEVREDQIVIWQDRRLKITAPPIPIGNRQWLELQCLEVK